MGYKKTYKLVKRLTDIISCGAVAQIMGKSIQTIEAWTRAPQSVEHPCGTGYKNVLDSALLLIGRAHKEDAALAREMAEIFPDYINALEGKQKEHCKASLPGLVGATVKEHSEAVFEIVNSEHPEWNRAYTEIVQAEVALGKLKAWVKDEMRTLTVVTGNNGNGVGR